AAFDEPQPARERTRPRPVTRATAHTRRDAGTRGAECIDKSTRSDTTACGTACPSTVANLLRLGALPFSGGDLGNRSQERSSFSAPPELAWHPFPPPLPPSSRPS